MMHAEFGPFWFQVKPSAEGELTTECNAVRSGYVQPGNRAVPDAIDYRCGTFTGSDYLSCTPHRKILNTTGILTYIPSIPIYLSLCYQLRMLTAWLKLSWPHITGILLVMHRLLHNG